MEARAQMHDAQCLAGMASSGITSLTLPASVTTVEGRANVLLGKCTELKEIIVDPANPSFISDDGVLLRQ